MEHSVFDTFYEKRWIADVGYWISVYILQFSHAAKEKARQYGMNVYRTQEWTEFSCLEGGAGFCLLPEHMYVIKKNLMWDKANSWA